MIRVIVADDEYFGRKVLIKKLQEVSPDIEICGEAEDGTEVMALLKEKEADVVVTDIRMPEMDGLEVAEQISIKYPEVRVIIESGYAEFEYATRAMNYGVKDYLTKPIKTEELRSAIERVQGQKRKEQNKIGRYMDFAHILENREISYTVLDDFFVHMKKSSWIMAVAQGKNGKPEEEQIQKILSIWGNQTAYFYPKNEFIFLFTQDELESTGYSFKRKIAECEKETGILLHMGVSQKFDKTEEFEKKLEVAYKQAVYAINQRLLQPLESIYFYDSKMHIKALFSREEERALEGCLREHKLQEAREIVNKLFLQCENSRDFTVYSLFASLIQIINTINRVYSAGSQDVNHAYLFFDFKSDFYHFQTLEKLKEYIFQLLADVAGEESVHSSIISDLLRYLEWNYQYDITVNELATRKYFVNPSYLSRLFKAETGMTFSRYLTQLRMRKAASLLKETSLKVGDIASYVGYNDVSYFIQTFKKYYEMTPDQYKK